MHTESERRTRALFLSLPLTGHLNPALALIRELGARGEEVTCYATDPFAAAIRATRARYRRYKDAELADLRGLPGRTDELASFLIAATGRILDAHLDDFRTARPDYIVADSVAPWGPWLARILDVPLVTSISTMAMNRHVMRYAFTHGVRPASASRLLHKLRHMAGAWQRRRRLVGAYGVAGPGVMASVMGSSQLNIVYTSRYFQPCAESFDDRFQFVGPMTQRDETATVDWSRVGAGDLVYVSLGTLFNADTAFYRTCLDAFAGEPVQLLLSVGRNVSTGALGEPPANVTVCAEVPQLAVLQKARAFVTHGGMNSVSESLSFGVPMVVVPQMGEQATVGRRVEELGAGLYLAKQAVTPAALRTLVRRLLTEPEFRNQAGLVQQSFINAGGLALAANAILRFTRREPANASPLQR